MDKITLNVPELCLVALVGATCSGKTSFAYKHFQSTEILSSDFFRGMVCDDETNQGVSSAAFELLHLAANKRLENGKLTVIDATNLQYRARKAVLDIAKAQNVLSVAIVLDLPTETLLERNEAKGERALPKRVIYNHCHDVKKTLKSLRQEGFRYVYVLDSLEKIDNVEIFRSPLFSNKKDIKGPLDIIGDLHGCYDELCLLLERLGYEKLNGVYQHPQGRKAVFLGDFCDRGDKNVDTIRLVMNMVQTGFAYAILGNHDAKLYKYLTGRKFTLSHGIEKTTGEMEKQDETFRKEVESFLNGLTSHFVFDDGRLVVAHAGIKGEYIGRSSGKVREFCLYGDTTGEIDSYGLPIRLDWAADYRGRATIVYGHVACKEPKFENNTVCIDTGAVYGGKLSCYRYPEREIVSVEALKQYYEPIKPLEEAYKKDAGDILSVEDFNTKLHITTRLLPSIDVHENNSAAALETMSRFAADPHWLIYLPPTMSPCETSTLENYLEYPTEAFGYYQKKGVKTVVCEKKHMGSRAVIVLCRNQEVAESRFGIKTKERGIIYTRTGRRFFDDEQIEAELLDRLDKILKKTGFWEDFETNWVCLDTELMPWSEKAKGLLKTQYAPTGNAGMLGLSDAVGAIEKTLKRMAESPASSSEDQLDLEALLSRYKAKKDDLSGYITAYREYCWGVTSIEDIRIAPFHVLAIEGKVFFEEKHVWHMETIKKYITGHDDIFMGTPYIVVDTENEESVQAGVDWWLSLTSSGGEGMVVKPETYTATNNGMILQPAIKCRGREYLRIIYGAEYLEQEHLNRLKVRSLSRKRTLALKEFSLGIEGLLRFIDKEPLYRIHECSFGVLALESEPVDPRL